MKRLLLVVATALVLGCGTKPTVWEFKIDLGGDENATALATDGVNYFISYVATKAGEARRAGWYVTKVSPEGKEIWTQAYKDSKYAIPEDITAAPDGRLFAVGRAESQGKEVCLVLCYQPNGMVAWQKGLAVGDKTWGMGVCLVPGDKIAVCGMAGDDTNSDYMVALLDAKDGRTAWVRNIDVGPTDLANHMYSDPNGNLVVVGQHAAKETPGNGDIITLRLKPNGDTAWTRTYESGGDDQAGDIAIDQFGNIIVTGTAVVRDSVRCVILEYADSGGVIRKSAFGQNAMATGNGLYITKESDIFITGRLLGKQVPQQQGKAKQTSEALAFQYNPSAHSVWERHYKPGSSADGIEVVANGDVYIAATVQNKTADAYVLRFSKPPVPQLPQAKSAGK
jgi:hypothetical protein